VISLSSIVLVLVMLAVMFGFAIRRACCRRYRVVRPPGVRHIDGTRVPDKKGKCELNSSILWSIFL
jgi:hypothetical protein